MKIFGGAGCAAVFGIALTISRVASASQAPENPLNDITETCTHPPYKIHIFSLSPLVIYIVNFLTPEERQHLLSITSNAFTTSQTADEHGTSALRSTRKSRSATPPRDTIVRCIESRALLFQGLSTPLSHLEPLQLVQYTQNETYDFHTDWFTSPSLASPSHGGNRLSSFFAYVLATDDITGGGTTFPLLDAPRDEKWCGYVDCDRPWDEGVTFLPVEGNAVFWVNMVGGQGDQRTLHRGDVVTSGRKMGMNIWTREGELDPELRGEGWEEDEL
ncbi:hypothetical protein M501DRAFT_1056887 [Patellaria atrata CBS 101060]|uniref:Fe2OG dioxygenase domain-containing protein n=1 Tax=Patellaria atrata CBS 101060 TaxID=1346257 RepID=A0A9P4SBM8_9PEZI|nr:hypothetical protein M501DRAFT_1056887 [Patellaria atrata CBS 101060]